MSKPLWSPGPERVAKAQMTAFALQAGFSSEGYEQLWSWSVREPDAFWTQVWSFCGVRAETRGARVLVEGHRMPGARWFPDARLSFAENLLWRRDEAPALIYVREDGLRREISFGELYARVVRAQAGFKRLGLRSGDRVAAFVPNLPEAVVAMLAVASLGGVWSSCSPDFGTSGVLDRFGQIEPRFLISADGYVYKGRRHDSLVRLREILGGLPSVEHALVIPHLEASPELRDIPRALPWTAVFDGLGSGPPAEPEFPALPFDHPLYILYSSGTTGKPKCIVHGAGGTLLQHLKEHRLHTDLGPGDRLFYFTTTGWMMWNWLVSGLASGATLVLYDGNPVHPSPGALFDLAEREGITVFGTSAKFLDACAKAGLTPARTHHLPSLRAILSTGSPLAPETFDYVYRDLHPDLLLASISGGTDIISCFVLGCPILPVWRGEIQCRGLGMKVEVFDPSAGSPEERSVVGQPGELVCTAPFPSMPVGFWNDPGGERYRAAYFQHFPGVWRHGDWVALTERGGMVIHGRSDATLNPGGVRIGTAEIYRQVEQIDDVVESIVIGQRWHGDQRIVLFVRLRPGLDLDDTLRASIRRRVREGASPRHVPAVILQVDDIPRTRSGKISEVAVRKTVHGEPIGNREALANPEALDGYRDRAELKDPDASA